MRTVSCFIFTALVFLAFSCKSGDSSKEKKNDLNIITTSSGLKYLDIKTGSGKSPEIGKTVVVHQIVRQENDSILENTYKNDLPFSFKLGADETIVGLEEGVMTMKVGGKRKLWVPSELGFGRRAMRTVPKNSILVIEVELLEIK